MSAISPEEAVAKSQMLHRLRRDEAKKAHDSSVVARAQDRQTRQSREKAEKAERIEKAVKAQRKLEKKFKGVAVSYGKFALLEESSADEVAKISSDEAPSGIPISREVRSETTSKKSRTKSASKPATEKKRVDSTFSPSLVYFAVGVVLGLGALAARHCLAGSP